jgi:AraC-like DNA-binding protein
MIYKQVKPSPNLTNYIDAFWVVEGAAEQIQATSILPDGCVDLIFNLGDDCKTDNRILENGKTYLVGTMTTSQKSFLNTEHKLMGVRFKPAAFLFFYSYTSLDQVTNQIIEFEKALSPDINKLKQYSVSYLNNYFLNRMNNQENYLFPVINDVRMSMGQISIDELAKRNFVTVRQLERSFKKNIGISPKEFVNILRFQFALEKIKDNQLGKSLQDIAFESGYYDHAHLSNEIKRYTGLSPSQF